MCGIFAYIGKSNDAGKKIVNGLKSLEYRGYDSWGIALEYNSKIYLEKHTGKINKHSVPQQNSSFGIGHTRWATHGGVTIKNAHPHTNLDNSIIVVHNGIIENFLQHKEKLIKKGYKFKSETDTEIIPFMLEEQLKVEEDKVSAVNSIFNKLNGLNAIICMFPKSKEFIAVKNGSPIVFTHTKEGMFLASDAAALAKYSQSVYFLEDYELLYFNNKTYKVFKNKKTKKIKFTTLPYSEHDTKKGQYPHFMIKEINEQPNILSLTPKSQKQHIKKIAQIVKKSYGTYFVGCGTAYYACLQSTYLMSKIAKRHINAQIGSEFEYVLDFIKKGSLVFALSQSGETIDVISSIQKAKNKDARIIAVTNVLGSTLYRMSDEKLLLNAGPEKCVLATKSFTTKFALIHLLAHELADKYHIGEKEILTAAKEVKNIIDQKEKIKKIAKNLKHKKNIFIIGRGLSYPLALESALKIKEVSYIHAEGFAGGDLKHGVIALIEKGTPVIIYNPEDETYNDTLTSAHEVKARGAHVIGVSSTKNEVYDEWIKVADCGSATGLPNVTVAQLLGYYLALEKKLDPDKPRNLAKSVTVK